MQSPDPTEIEARLILIGRRRETALREIRAASRLGECTPGAFSVLELKDEYFDLAHGELTRGKCALRVRYQLRAGVETCLVAFKGPAGEGNNHRLERLELEGPWPGKILKRISEELRRRGLECRPEFALDGQAAEALAQLGFAPIQSRCTRREVAPLTCGSAVVAELALDAVRFQISQTTVMHREIEVEARGTSTAEDVLALSSDMQQRFGADLMAWPWTNTALGGALEDLDEAGELPSLLEHSEIHKEGYLRLDEFLRRK